MSKIFRGFFRRGSAPGRARASARGFFARAVEDFFKKNVARATLAAMIFSQIGSPGGAVPMAFAAADFSGAENFAWGEGAGWISAAGAEAGGYGIAAADDRVTGEVWSEAAGWIYFGSGAGPFPAAGSQTAADFGAVNLIGGGEGILSGWGWGEGAGWVQFSGSVGAESFGLVIDENGYFSSGSTAVDHPGWAWSETLGWIDFAGQSAAGAGFRTDWRPGVAVTAAAFQSSTAVRVTTSRAVAAVDPAVFSLVDENGDPIAISGVKNPDGTAFTGSPARTDFLLEIADQGTATARTGTLTVAGLDPIAAQTPTTGVAALGGPAFLTETGTPNGPATVAVSDENRPVILSRETVDLDADGTLDAVKMTFSEGVTASGFGAGDFAVQTATGLALGTAFADGSWNDIAGNAIFYLEATGQPAGDTGLIFEAKILDGSGIRDAAGNLLDASGDTAGSGGTAAEAGFTAAADGAAPILLSASAGASAAGSGIDAVRLVFSENLAGGTENPTAANFSGATVAGAGTGFFDENDLAGDAVIFAKITPDAGVAGTTGLAGDFLKFSAAAGLAADAAGNLSPAVATGAVATVDAARPVLRSVAAEDADADGDFDRLRVGFSENISDASFAAGSAGLTAAVGLALGAGGTSNDSEIFVDFTPAGTGSAIAPGDLEFFVGTGAVTDSAGNGAFLSATGAVATADAAGPVLLGVRTADADADGSIDGLVADFSENLSAATATGLAVSGGFQISGVAATGATATISLLESGAGDTAATPVFTISADSGIRDAAGNLAPGTGATATDGAGPVVTSALFQRDAGQFVFQFSEAVDLATLGADPAVELALGGGPAWGTDSSFFLKDQNYALVPIGATAATEPAFTGGETAAFVAGAVADPAGNPSPTATGVAIRDGATPFILSATTVDRDADGFLDAIDAEFSEAVTIVDATATGWTISAENSSTLTATGIAATGDPRTVRILFENNGRGGPDTGTTPGIATAGLAVTDAEGNPPAAQSFSATADGAAPIAVRTVGFSATGADLIFVDFSEEISLGGAAFQISSTNGNSPAVSAKSVEGGSRARLALAAELGSGENFTATGAGVADSAGNFFTQNLAAGLAVTDAGAAVGSFSLTALEEFFAGLAPAGIGQPDSDADGIADATEWAAAGDLTTLSSRLGDADGDGLPDLWEKITGETDPTADTDGDGLPAILEMQNGTDLAIADPATDSDTDGLPDGWETANGLDPADAADATVDPDADGRTSAQEFFAGTDPRRATEIDADGDDLPDAWEIAFFGTGGTVPTADPDADGIRNLAEFFAGLSPTVDAATEPDADSDGLPDIFENAIFGNLGEAGTGDPDGDGRPTLAELRTATPVNSAANGADSDGDSMPDRFEKNFGLSAGAAADGSLDPDGDGVLSAVEFWDGTDPSAADADSDGDGMPDIFENLSGLDPADPADAASDADGDGIPARIEFQNATRPDAADDDADADGLPDRWEAAHRTGSGTATDLTTDGDGDGLTRFEEFLTGSDPRTAQTGPTAAWKKAWGITPTARSDADGDGILDIFEFWNGTDPTAADADSDADGLPDIFEKSHGLDPAAPTDPTADPDGDGRPTGLELRQGTEPTRVEFDFATRDADTDGLPDSWENAFFGSTAAQDYAGDADADGISNIREFYRGTDPGAADADSDADGLADSWEIDRFGGIGATDGTGDADADGATDLAEFVAASDPAAAPALPGDSDGDRMSDAWEFSFGLAPFSATDTTDLGPAGDPDTDIFPNLTDENPRGHEGRGATLDGCGDQLAPQLPASFAAVLTGENAEISWSAVGDPDSPEMWIFRSAGIDGGAATDPIARVPASDLKFTDPGLARGQIYRYSFRVFDACGLRSPLAGDALTVIPGLGALENFDPTAPVTLSISLLTKPSRDAEIIRLFRGVSSDAASLAKKILAAGAEVFAPSRAAHGLASVIPFDFQSGDESQARALRNRRSAMEQGRVAGTLPTPELARREGAPTPGGAMLAGEIPADFDPAVWARAQQKILESSDFKTWEKSAIKALDPVRAARDAADAAVRTAAEIFEKKSAEARAAAKTRTAAQKSAADAAEKLNFFTAAEAADPGLARARTERAEVAAALKKARAARTAATEKSRAAEEILTAGTAADPADLARLETIRGQILLAQKILRTPAAAAGAASLRRSFETAVANSPAARELGIGGDDFQKILDGEIAPEPLLDRLASRAAAGRAAIAAATENRARAEASKSAAAADLAGLDAKISALETRLMALDATIKTAETAAAGQTATLAAARTAAQKSAADRAAAEANFQKIAGARDAAARDLAAAKKSADRADAALAAAEKTFTENRAAELDRRVREAAAAELSKKSATAGVLENLAAVARDTLAGIFEKESWRSGELREVFHENSEFRGRIAAEAGPLGELATGHRTDAVLEIYPAGAAGGEPIARREFATDFLGDGNLSFAGLPLGEYDLVLRVDGALAEARRGVILAPGANAVKFENYLVFSDLDGDGAVDPADLADFAEKARAGAGPDLDEDGKTGLSDLSQIYRDLGRTAEGE